MAVIPWLPILLYIDDIEAFKPLTRDRWKRKLLIGTSVVFWLYIWVLLWYSGKRYLANKWPKKVSFDEADSDFDGSRHSTTSNGQRVSDDRSTRGNYSSSDDSLRQEA
jgi:hypothetical protein